jgi:MFS transporter, Spinster family, sphingosine-1-phosphate transporter
VPYLKEEFFAPGQDHGWFVNQLLSWLGGLLGSHNPENALMGLLAMAFMLSYMCMAPIFSALGMRRWTLVGLSGALWSLATGFCGMASNFGNLLLRRAAVGVGEAGYGPIAPTLIADYYPVEKRGSVLAWFYAAIPVGSAIGFVLGGLVAAQWGWRWAFYVVVPPGLILAAIAMFLKEPKAGAADDDGTAGATTDAKPTWRETYVRLLTTPSYVLCTLGMAMMTFAIGGIGFWMPDYVHSVRGVENLAMVNTIFGGILVVAGLSATLLGGRLADYLRDRVRGSYFTVSGIAMLVGFPCSLVMLFVPFPYAWIFVFLAAFCLFFNTGPTNAILVNVTHPAMRPAAMALNIFVIHALGDVISPLVIGAVTDATGSMNIAFVVVSLTVLVGGVLWLIGARFLARDTARVTPRAAVGR